VVYSLHSILRDVYDPLNGSFRVLFESGGGGAAYSDHTIFRAVYDETNSALRVSGVDGITPVKFYAHLNADEDVTTVNFPIPWHSDRAYGYTHSDGDSLFTVPETGDYMIMATVAVDYVAGENIYVEIQRRS
jgi:hypothetical protein